MAGSELDNVDNGAGRSRDHGRRDKGGEEAPRMAGLPPAVRMKVDDSPLDVTSGLFLGAVLDGGEPYCRMLTLDHTIDFESICLDGMIVERRVGHEDLDTVLLRGCDSSVLALISINGATIWLAAQTGERLAHLIAEVTTRTQQIRDPGVATVSFWRRSQHRGVCTHRDIEVPGWDEIASNYPSDVANEIRSLLCVEKPSSQGRLILWHGDPGTGKTTAIRALIRSWSGWCEPHYIADPEKFFAESDYMIQVLMAPTDAAPSTEWKVLIAEDADDYLRADARARAGASLGRLLNLTDGILGQGLKMLMLLTTNEPLSMLHPAIVRPGRCVARTEFRRFRQSEAVEWLGRSTRSIPSDGATLADLFEIRGELARIGNRPEDLAPTGQYL